MCCYKRHPSFTKKSRGHTMCLECLLINCDSRLNLGMLRIASSSHKKQTASTATQQINTHIRLGQMPRVQRALPGFLPPGCKNIFLLLHPQICSHKDHKIASFMIGQSCTEVETKNQREISAPHGEAFGFAWLLRRLLLGKLLRDWSHAIVGNTGLDRLLLPKRTRRKTSGIFGVTLQISEATW